MLKLRDWLVEEGVTLVGMEATGVYWKPVYYALEGRFELWLCNAHHVKNVPGRKTDISDAQWLCQLMEAGLLRGSFVPPKPQRRLRTLTRYRKTQIAERQREAKQRPIRRIPEHGSLGCFGFCFLVLGWLRHIKLLLLATR